MSHNFWHLFTCQLPPAFDLMGYGVFMMVVARPSNTDPGAVAGSTAGEAPTLAGYRRKEKKKKKRKEFSQREKVLRRGERGSSTFGRSDVGSFSKQMGKGSEWVMRKEWTPVRPVPVYY